MTKPKPTTGQRDLLRAIAAGNVRAYNGADLPTAYALSGPDDMKIVTAAVERIIARGWAAPGPTSVALTAAGRSLIRRAPQRGDEFTHLHMLDPWWQPGPGERYVDAPHARMVITRVTSVFVYYAYANANTSGGNYKIDRFAYERDYPITEETQ